MTQNAPIRRPGKTRATVERLARAILTGAIPSRTRLDLEQLRADTGLAASTFHDVLARLSDHGLISGRQNLGTFVTDPDQWHLTDAAVLGWLASDKASTLGTHTAELTDALETLAAMLPDSPLIAALARALGAPQPEGCFGVVQPNRVFPYELNWGIDPGGNPRVYIDTHERGARDELGEPYAKVWVNDGTVYNRALPQPEVIPGHGVVLPTARWLISRSEYHDPEMTRQLRDAIGFGTPNPLATDDAATAMLAWARTFGPVYTVGSADRPSALDADVVVATFADPDGQWMAAVLTTEHGSGTVATADVHHTRADNCAWSEFDTYTVRCETGHTFSHRAGVLTEVGVAGVPVGRDGGSQAWGRHCPRCQDDVRLTMPGL